ncbi:MAG: TIGR02466 family protein [Sphingomonas fennica]
MSARALFPTLLWQAPLGDDALLADLDHSARALAAEDAAGRRWCREHGYRGYTSYASLNDLPRRDPAFADLKRRLDRHVAAFAEAAAFDLGGRKLRLDSLWVNVLKPGGHHAAHIHPHSVVSGTLYVTMPDGAGALKLEDPRLPMLMAAPPRNAAAGALATFQTIAPAAGDVLLWESWLRHEVLANGAKAERISISFNYAMR